MNYYSLNKYLKNTFGEKVYKISLNGNMTCPNRDGTLGTRGCIFCSRGGSGEFASDALLPVHGQIDQAKLRIKKKSDCKKFIAYFQPFTNTYAPIEYLEKIFTDAISEPDIVALSIATRPDCLGNNVLGLLEKLNKIKPVWVELGLQTIHEKSADYIRRMYPLSVYDSATENLHKIGINVITHIILGLPNESKKMMLESVKYAGSKTDGIKLQLLHVLKNTDLCDEYITGGNFSLEVCENEISEKQKEYKKGEEEFSLREFATGLGKFNSFELKNAAVASQLVDGNIFLGLSCGNELGEDLQDEVRKSMIGAYLSLSKHNKMFFNGGIDDTLEELEDKLYAKFLEYIRKFS